MLAKQALRPGVPLTLAAAAAVMWAGRPWASLALTIAAAATMINAFLLEFVLGRLLQPGVPHVTRGAVVIGAVRWGVWLALLVVWYLVRERVESWAVAAGVACSLAALAIAGAGSVAAGPGKG